MQDQNKQLSVIMPALNEEQNICKAVDETLEAFRHFGINGEIILINDGSRDGTRSLMEQKTAENAGRVCLISHDKPHGIGASFWEGVDCACGEIVVMLPGDNENDPLETMRYYKLLEHVDIVIPFIFNRQARPFYRNILSFVFRFIINTTFLVNFNYTNGTVLYRKSILKELSYHSKGFFYQTDILVRSVKSGYLFAEVPYRVGRRTQGHSKALTFPSFIMVIAGYFKLVKDYYFSGRHNRADRHFSSDSATAKRR